MLKTSVHNRGSGFLLRRRFYTRVRGYLFLRNLSAICCLKKHARHIFTTNTLIPIIHLHSQISFVVILLTLNHTNWLKVHFWENKNKCSLSSEVLHPLVSSSTSLAFTVCQRGSRRCGWATASNEYLDSVCCTPNPWQLFIYVLSDRLLFQPLI